jgi:hypothetical protein
MPVTPPPFVLLTLATSPAQALKVYVITYFLSLQSLSFKFWLR